MRFRTTVIIASLFAALPLTSAAQDRTTYSEGSRPKVLINWESFEDEGFPSEWKGPFTNLVINAYTRLNRVIGVDVRPQFWDYTTKTDSDAGEIVIMANEKHASSGRLASTFGSFPDRLKIVVHRKRGSDLTVWNFTPFWPNDGEISLYATILHEMGHTLGLDHNGTGRSMMNSIWWVLHFGPWETDRDQLRSLYRLADDNRLRQLATYDGGGSWFVLNNNITNLNARTTNSVAAAGTDGGTYVVGWTTPNNRLSWISGDGVSFDTDGWWVYGGGPEVIYGGAMATDDDTYLWAFVDGGSNDLNLKVIRSTDDAGSWHYVNFPAARTYGRPGITTTMVDGRRAWIVVWAHLDEADRDETGFLYGSVSFDNGSSWSAPHRVDGFYRVHDGVSIEALPNGSCRIAFAWAGELGRWAYGQNKVRTLTCSVSGAGTVSRSSICYGDVHSRLAPDLAWHEGASRYVLGVREQDRATSLDSMSGTTTNCPGDFLHIDSSTSHVAPTLASSPFYNETVMWYARD